jgi:hypothetical protein
MSAAAVRQPQPDPGAELTAAVHDLTEPAIVETRQDGGWTKSRHRRPATWVRQRHPSLLDQVRALAHPSMQRLHDAGRTVPDSRPAANLDAVDYLRKVEAELSVWRYALSIERRDTVEDHLRALRDTARVLDRATLLALASDVVGWRDRARTITGWGHDR